MSVRPDPKEAGQWIIDYYPQGRKAPRKRITFNGTKEEAYRAEQNLRTSSKERPKSLSSFPAISETIPAFLEWYGLDHQPSGTERTNRSLQILKGFFGRYQFTSITEDMIEGYRTKRLDYVKRTTINKELAALSKLLKWAKKKGYCQKTPIVERFPNKMTEAPLPNIPDQEDIEKLIEAVPWPKQGILYCLYYGGLRKSEACTLTAEKVNLAKRTMYIMGKGGKERVVPILKYLEPILTRRLEEVKEGYLWATPESNRALTDLREIISWGSKRANIESHITPHSLRHAFGVRAILAGVHLRTVQIILGHSSSKVTEIYTRLATAQILKDVDRF